MVEELDRGRPLFNNAVAVQVKFPDHEKTLELTLRVLHGSRAAPVGSGGGQREGVLHIEITDELDPFFLYTLQVGEDDYHQLKHDQCLRVDFKSFPRKFIELLKSCPSGRNADSRENFASGGGGDDGDERDNGCAREDGANWRRRGEAAEASGCEGPSFLARLETHAPDGFSVFSLVETNPFKELTHLSLRFRAGNDVAIKTYLAARLRQLKAKESLTASALEDTRTSLEEEEAERARLDREASALRLDRERDLRDLRAAHSAELTAAREDGVRRAEEVAAVRASEMDALRRKAESDVAEVSRRLRQSEQRREELTDLKFAHEAELRDLRSRSEAGEAGREAAYSDAKTLRGANAALEARAFEAEREAERLKMQVAALTQQLADAKEMVEKSQALQAASGETVARLEDTQEAYKDSVVALQERLEASVNEINRGNAIIQKLQGQYRALRSKAKLKSEVIKQQERLLAEHEASASAGESKLKAAAAERRAAEARAEGLQRELTASEGRLEESARLLASNQQVIKWLNKELNDAQMVPGGTTTAAAAAVAGGYGGASSPLGGTTGSYNFGVEGNAGVRGDDTGVGGGGGGIGNDGRDAMFTAGIRESLTGGVSWDLRGTTLGGGEQNDGYFSYRRDASGDAPSRVGADSTPDHAGRANEYGAGRGPYTRIVTPETADASDAARLPRVSSGDGKRGRQYGGDINDELEGELQGGGDIHGIRAF